MTYPFGIGLVALAAFMVTLKWPDGAPTVSLDAVGSATRFSCLVEYVNDGDTLRCTGGIKVRLHAVAARELDETCTRGHPCPSASGAEARAALSKLVGSQWLSCEKTGASYDRIAAICWTAQGVEVNCAMIQSGKAVVWARFNRERAICQN